MKKIKSFLLHLLIIYTIFIVVSSIITLINYSTKVELYDSEENIIKYNELKQESNFILEDNACHNTIKEVINFYEKTSYKGEVNVKELGNYFEIETPLTLAVKLVNNCNEYKEYFEMENVYGKFIAATSLYEEIFYKSNIFKYEINIKDNYSRSLYGSEMTNLEYNAMKKLELKIINELLEVVRENKYEE